MPAKVGCLAIDPIDPGGLAPFWCGLLGVQVDSTMGDGEFLILSPAEDEQPGGQWLEPGTPREFEGFQWRCRADPEGDGLDLDVLPADS
jgi:hypothetical protein